MVFREFFNITIISSSCDDFVGNETRDESKKHYSRWSSQCVFEQTFRWRIARSFSEGHVRTPRIIRIEVIFLLHRSRCVDFISNLKIDPMQTLSENIYKLFIDQSGFSNIIAFESTDFHVNVRESTKVRFVLLFKRKTVLYVYYWVFLKLNNDPGQPHRILYA